MLSAAKTAVRNMSSGSGSRFPLLKGIFPPILTCFKANGDLDLAKLSENLQKLNQTGISGYVAFGSNGEFPLLSSDEKREILKTAKAAAVDGKKVLIAGAGSESLRMTIDNCKMANEVGADAALVTTPWFYKGMMTSENLVPYFSAVADASPLPVILYNVPSNTGVELEADAVLKLSGHKNIMGIKDSGGNIAKIGTMVGGTKNEDFQVLAGSAGFLLPSLMLGAVGGVLGVANVLPRECVELYDLFERGKMEQAVALQHRLIAPNDMVTRRHGIPAVKAMMDRYGYFGGPVRSPLVPLKKEVLDRVVAVFEEHGFQP